MHQKHGFVVRFLPWEQSFPAVETPVPCVETERSNTFCVVVLWILMLVKGKVRVSEGFYEPLHLLSPSKYWYSARKVKR